jgi:hypothetical protein
VGAPTIVPGYGPNTRTIMQVKIAANPPAAAFDLGTLADKFTHQADGSGVFEAGQHPIIVGQAAYNAAYGTSFAAASNCNYARRILQRCDGLVRINDTSTFGFNTLLAPTVRMTMTLQPKAIHDEMNATTFDEFGRMQANLGVEAQPPTPGNQNVTLYPYVNPATEIIDATNLPRGGTGIDVTPIATASDGTQIWRITHNGVDTHPIHFHLYDVQLLNRVTWDNIIIPPDPTELGWKDTVRVSPLQDTIVALRPVIPTLPFEIPNAVRMLNPMMPALSPAMFNNVAPDGQPLANNILNQLVNFGWEYVYHCHILSHEEMDMMRPVSVAIPPRDPDGLAYTISGAGSTLSVDLTWNDNTIAETAYLVQRQEFANGQWSAWTDLATVQSPLDVANTTGTKSYSDNAVVAGQQLKYRVQALNKVGYGDGTEFPVVTVKSQFSNELAVDLPLPPVVPNAPTNLSAVLGFGPQITLSFTDNANDGPASEAEFVLEKKVGNGPFAQIILPANPGTGVVTYVDTAVQPNTSVTYQVYARNAAGGSGLAGPIVVNVPATPLAPTNLVLTFQGALPPTGPRIQLVFRDNQTDVNPETGFQIFRRVNGGAFSLLMTLGPRAGVGNVTWFDTAGVGGNTYAYYVVTINATSASLPSNTASLTIQPVPTMPATFNGTTVKTGTTARVSMVWTDSSNNETRFVIQRATNAAFTQNVVSFNRAANTTAFDNTGLPLNTTYYYRIRAENNNGVSAWRNLNKFPITTPP